MDIFQLNHELSQGKIEIFPHLSRLEEIPYHFKPMLGLEELPPEPGILFIRGPRQYGKSTWLEQQLVKTIQQFGSGTAYYLNGDNISDADTLQKEIEYLIPLFVEKAPVRRIFIDEITAIPKFEMALKRLADSGKIRQILLITTGSKATDLRRGSERLPGRKGKLDRSIFYFPPISYKEFHRLCGKALGKQTLISYLISGGSPIACNELAVHGFIPEYVIELVRGWIEGEMSRSGRTRQALFNIMSVLFKFGGTPVGQAKLAREAGLANNTVASGYIEILNDLGCVIPAYPWDLSRKLLILRKPCKYHFTNLLAAVAYHPQNIRSPEDFLALSPEEQGIWYEWLVAQELLRRAAIRGEEILEPFSFWQNAKHEIDFVLSPENFLEVKRGTSSVMEMAWFPHMFPEKQLIVVNNKKFDIPTIHGVTLEEFLLDG